MTRAILATEQVIDDPETSKLLQQSGLQPLPQQAQLNGVLEEVRLYEIP